MAGTIVTQKLKSVLSLGIGYQVVSGGFVSMLTNQQIDSYDIVESAESIIAEFRDRHKAINNINLYHNYFENFSSNKKYDAIEMGFILEHVDDPQFILNRFKDFLTENGMIFIAVPNARSLHRLIGHYADLLPNIYELSQYDLQLGHKRYFDLPHIEDLVNSCGLKIITKKGLMLKPITGEQIKKLGWGDNIISALMIIGESYPEIANCIYIEAQK
ncbi:MAG: methyltransferase domain-containing protein [Bacteroidia bacterium]|nr:methyltransferase domain-containing protein [Bacteroidia bacterium]